ncbi:Putative bromodomain, E3 ubiquitin ligase RBR family, Bromodomain-like superfamily [Septoria linicola]|uniref:Bromodomain, E3 ubiquitin ligase RBR family, Bromodomain-like superfamily n=1 Tax=Septoria linicola TaxID=215465 RepID=A0A9Q9EES6_9PEZI|nr:putative bromodomain, E3 ubiquitin ligase RBR family, Bromodomain-like superfamily [Septoria linicola]USW46817.1 Putative bromodomain, E3 ubiquitin ligase RBR family, Bromodomain-like superfamily [Septoria linicola]
MLRQALTRRPERNRPPSPRLQRSQRDRGAQTGSASPVSQEPLPEFTSIFEAQAVLQGEPRSHGEISRPVPSLLENHGPRQPVVGPAPNSAGPTAESIPAKVPLSEPTSKCTGCYDEHKSTELVKACRITGCVYCHDCLTGLFDAATPANPAKCCSIIQLYTVLPQYPQDKADAYRQKVEEWLTPKKLYCPNPSCSAFIHPRHIPDQYTDIPTSSVPQVARRILDDLYESDSSRFFHGENDISKRPQFRARMQSPLGLDELSDRVLRSTYTDIVQFASDFRIIARNARICDTTCTRIIDKASRELEAVFLKSVIRALQSSQQHQQAPLPYFPCPDCKIAICNKGCKDIVHGILPCVTSQRDEEDAMLSKFGYKRCPNCQEGIRRMHGCTHMACTCGAHWCWNCLRSIDDCDTESCGPGDGGYEEDFQDFQDHVETDDEGSEGADEDTDAPNEDRTMQEHRDIPAAEPTEQAQVQVASAPNGNDKVHNLDGGGDDRWANAAAMNFGDEPEDTGLPQIWSCRHEWELFESPTDGYYHGDLSCMSCNRCSGHVYPPTETQVSTAFDCSRCKLIVCSVCKARYEEERQQN